MPEEEHVKKFEVREEGVVKWFNDAKGYGFITPASGKPDLFVHHSSIIAEGFRTLSEGDRVSFIVAPGPKNIPLQATKVIKIS